MTEFELIERYFNFSKNATGVVTGIGDDAAVLEPGSARIAVSVDTLVAGVHFPLDATPADIGYKALAVNLSDMAAMAATPRWFTLSLVLPDADTEWLQAFAKSLATVAQQYDIALIGGDTTRGPLSISIQIMGSVADQGAVLRSTAQPDQDIYVSGSLGDAAVGLLFHQKKINLPATFAPHCLSRLNRPTPRVSLGISLQEQATAMIDCSDGFAADLGHILDASNVGAEISFRSLPLSTAVEQWLENGGDPALVITGGDDYELIFTAPGESREQIEALASKLGCPVSRVGKTVKQKGLRILDADNHRMTLDIPGYNHFPSANP